MRKLAHLLRESQKGARRNMPCYGHTPFRAAWSSQRRTPPRCGSWSSLSESQRAAWELLGWDADRWEGRQAPPPSLSWAQLSPTQQAAASHGLGYTQKEWDLLEQTSGDDKHEIITQDKKEPQSVKVNASVFADDQQNKEKESLTSILVRAAWNVAHAVAPAEVDTLVERTAPPVVVNDVETTLYLDDSPSMNEWTGWFSFKTRLQLGKKVLRSLAPVLGSSPCRVLKFSDQPTVLSPRKKGGVSLSQVSSGWDGSGDGTYLWHMIQTDVLNRYRPGTGKLRLVVVTDGDDNMSPSNYQGMTGMDPMMRVLQEAGYDIEWHIIVIGKVPGAKRYQALAGATGGSFLQLQNEFDETSREASILLDAIEKSTDDYDRRERQRSYERDAEAGKIDKLDWYRELPPPGKKK